MQRLPVRLGNRTYDILIGPALLPRLAEFVAPLSPTSLHIVCTEVVAPLYGQAALAACRSVAHSYLVAIPDGEGHKDLATASRVIDALVGNRADRRSIVIALGGGVVGDIAGFAAATFMRGVRVVQVPTTLLAQVDSSVGGKTGVNHPRGKNLIGAFHQPSAVIADISALATLPDRELRAGLAEVIKHGLLADLPLLLARDPAALERAVHGSCAIKAAVVGRDERESGERALLNLGHTFGHAIETLTGYTTWLHGEAVACGLVLATDLSRRLGLVGPEIVDTVRDAVARAGLPARIPGLDRKAAIAAMRGDKKAYAGRVEFVVLERIGQAVRRPADEALVEATLADGGFV